MTFYKKTHYNMFELDSFLGGENSLLQESCSEWLLASLWEFLSDSLKTEVVRTAGKIPAAFVIINTLKLNILNYITEL